MRGVHLMLPAKAATLTVGCIGIQTAETVHMAADHHRGLDHQLETNRALEPRFVDDGAEGTLFHSLKEPWIKSIVRFCLLKLSAPEYSFRKMVFFILWTGRLSTIGNIWS